MSVRVMAQVWANSKVKGSALLLELAISDWADDAGRAFPAVETMADKIRMTERQTRRLVRLLETSGELTTSENGGPHGVNVYHVHPGGVKITPVSLPPRTFQVARGGKNRSVGGTHVTPEPPRNHQEPPELASQDARRTGDDKEDAQPVPLKVVRAGSPELAAWLARRPA